MPDESHVLEVRTRRTPVVDLSMPPSERAYVIAREPAQHGSVWFVYEVSERGLEQHNYLGLGSQSEARQYAAGLVDFIERNGCGFPSHRSGPRVSGAWLGGGRLYIGRTETETRVRTREEAERELSRVAHRHGTGHWCLRWVEGGEAGYSFGVAHPWAAPFRELGQE